MLHVGLVAVGFLCGKCKDEWPASHYHDFGDAKPCHNCGRPVRVDYNRNIPLPLVCSDECRRAVYAKLARERRQNAEQVCATCGNDFIPKRSDAKYCSVACKQKAYRARGRLE